MANDKYLKKQVTVKDGLAYLPFAINADQRTEGDETLSVSVTDASNNLVGEASVLIKDTSGDYPTVFPRFKESTVDSSYNVEVYGTVLGINPGASLELEITYQTTIESNQSGFGSFATTTVNSDKTFSVIFPQLVDFGHGFVIGIRATRVNNSTYNFRSVQTEFSKALLTCPSTTTLFKPNEGYSFTFPLTTSYYKLRYTTKYTDIDRKSTYSGSFREYRSDTTTPPVFNMNNFIIEWYVYLLPKFVNDEGGYGFFQVSTPTEFPGSILIESAGHPNDGRVYRDTYGSINWKGSDEPFKQVGVALGKDSTIFHSCSEKLFDEKFPTDYYRFGRDSFFLAANQSFIVKPMRYRIMERHIDGTYTTMFDHTVTSDLAWTTFAKQIADNFNITNPQYGFKVVKMTGTYYGPGFYNIQDKTRKLIFVTDSSEYEVPGIYFSGTTEKIIQARSEKDIRYEFFGTVSQKPPSFANVLGHNDGIVISTTLKYNAGSVNYKPQW